MLMKTAKCTLQYAPGTGNNGGNSGSDTNSIHYFYIWNDAPYYIGNIKFTQDGQPFILPPGTYIVESTGTDNQYVLSDRVHSYTVTVTGADISNIADLADSYLYASLDDSSSGGSQGGPSGNVDISGRIDYRSYVYTFPKDVFIVINETLKSNSFYTRNGTSVTRYLQVVPLRYDEYLRLMSKPYKRPLKYQAWRLINSGIMTKDGDLAFNEGQEAWKYVEIIIGPNDNIGADDYSIRYVRTPMPIIVGDLDQDNLSIDGYSTRSAMCELDPILHEDVLQRAVELAKIAWTATGQDNAQAVIASGERSE